MAVNYGSKRTVVGASYGFKDWLLQRISAGIMVFFTLALLLQILFFSGPLDYQKWAGIFSGSAMKALTFLTFVSLAYHAWIGMRDIWMDYIKPVWLRLLLHIATAGWIIGCLGWAVQALWRL